MLKKTHGASDRGIRPLDILVGRTDEHLVDARGVSAISLHQVVRRNAVSFGLRHDHAAPLDHPLSEEPGEWLDRVGAPRVVQHLLKEARVEQVKDRVLYATRVLVDGHPVIGQLGIERLRLVVS